MKSELQPHRQRSQSPEMEMDSIFNVLNVLESDPFVNKGNASDLSAEERIHSDGTSRINYDESKALDDTKNAINRRFPIDITSDDMNHFTITPQTTTDITPKISRRNGYIAFDDIASFGI